MAFDVKKEQPFNKTIRMPESMIYKLERISAEKDVSFAQAVIQCCEYALENRG